MKDDESNKAMTSYKEDTKINVAEADSEKLMTTHTTYINYTIPYNVNRSLNY